MTNENPYAPPVDGELRSAWPEGQLEHRAGARNEWRLVFADDALYLKKEGEEGALRVTREELAKTALVRTFFGQKALLALAAPVKAALPLSREATVIFRDWMGPSMAELRRRSLASHWIGSLLIGIFFASAPFTFPGRSATDTMWDVACGGLFVAGGLVSRLVPSIAGRGLIALAWLVFVSNILRVVFATGASHWQLLLVPLGVLAAAAHISVAVFFRKPH